MSVLTKAQAIKIVTDCARQYKNNLANRMILLLVTDKHNVEDKKSKRFVPNTVLKVDIRDYTNETYRIIATYRKYKTDAEYSEIVYVAKKVEWDKIKFPNEYSYLPKPGK